MYLLEPLERRSLMSVSPTAYPDVDFTLTPDAIRQTGVTRGSILDRLERVVRAQAKYQNSSGAIIDPFAKREVQYSTPYFAAAAATLIAAGRATDLLAKASLAMDRATASYAGGKTAIPDQHGEFYLYPLAEAYKLLRAKVPVATASRWLSRLGTPISSVITGLDWNWRSYAMKGAWALYGIGAISRGEAVNFIETGWTTCQRNRVAQDPWNLYHDNTSDPDTMAYDFASRGNLSYLIVAGYNGASAGEISAMLRRGSEAGLYLVDPTGQAPAPGRSGNHVWNDVVAAVTFERMARIELAEGDTASAGRYRRAANLAVLSSDRWLRKDGSYTVTKNRFCPSTRTGYADYSFLTNYNGYMMLHLAELYQQHLREIAEVPMPAEVGGYAITPDPDFASAIAAAGGVQVTASLRGQTSLNYGQLWSQLGIGRISKAGWDSRLGALSASDPTSGVSVSLAPMLNENGTWKSLAALASRYQASFISSMVSPQLTKCAIVYAPRSGQSGPTYTQLLTITPDGVLVRLTGTSGELAMSLPLLVNDGAALRTSITGTAATTRFSAAGDALSYVGLDAGTTLTDTRSRIHAATGDYATLIARNPGGSVLSVFVRPSHARDVTPDRIRSTYRTRRGDFSTLLGRTIGNTYQSARSAGGLASSIDLNSDGVVDIVLSRTCQFSARLINGVLSAIETDADVRLTIKGRVFRVAAHVPRAFV